MPSFNAGYGTECFIGNASKGFTKVKIISAPKKGNMYKIKYLEANNRHEINDTMWVNGNQLREKKTGKFA